MANSRIGRILVQQNVVTMDFIHLHCHTQFSLLDGAADIATMMDKALEDGMKGLALTDHGNMFGAFKFVAQAQKRKLKPIVGCEFYLVEDRHQKSFPKGKKDKRYHQLLLAKNPKGYENLSKLCSLGFLEGMYSKYPRIDKELILKYHEGLIATSCCIGAEIPQAILRGDLEKAEAKLRWWVEVFGADFYIEIQRHKGLENIDETGVSQEDINQQLLVFAHKYGLKVIATNDSHYVEEEDWFSHDILLCVNTGELLQETKRFKFPSSDFYFKRRSEMAELFADVPESLENTLEVFDKIEALELSRDVLLPAFPLPEGFEDQGDYLRYLTYEGARQRYGELTEAVRERLDFELATIIKSGYPGYFLIVQDFTTEARRLGVWVGPGRGSAAGSAVAYCLGITNVDPIAYNLLFERFLNPERVSMPDIDIDFDDEGRQKVIDYVVDKYGHNQVAQIITYGSMAAKSSLRDVGRVMNVPLSEVDKVAKSFPDHLSATLKKVLAKDGVEAKLKENLNSEELGKANEFRKLAQADDDIGKMIRTAQKLEGSIRNTGVHACGVVITPDDITKYVPVTTAKDSDLLLTQFDNSVAESAGLLKMDFLGLKTLTIIKHAIQEVERRHQLRINPDEIPLDDAETYKLFQRGDTVAIFQYESAGMQKYLRELQPTKFEDLIAMNALYRPGPLEYIPEFIARKHGRKPIVYDLPDMEEYLRDTYGITVYQEQVMLLSQKLAGFSKGQADALRKAMGKKQKAIIDKLFPDFLKGGLERQHPEQVLAKIWKDWEAFASYAFNKSHSTCYAYVAFHTAYLKAHYPAEFMASVLSNNSNDIAKVQFFLQECQSKGLVVLGPDINESSTHFNVNAEGKIRFSLTAIKGVGAAFVEEVLRVRQEGGVFSSIFDLMRRLDPQTVNKKYLESLVYSGAFDCFGLPRATYFELVSPSDKLNFLETLLRYNSRYKTNTADLGSSLFGGFTAEPEDLITEPKLPNLPKEWDLLERLNREKEVVGLYLSGHPLDDYRFQFQRSKARPIANLEKHKDQTIKIAGIITDAQERTNMKGQGYGRFTIQDFEQSLELAAFGETYAKYGHLFKVNEVLVIQGKYTRGYGGKGSYEFRIDSAERLAESAKTAKAMGICLSLRLEQIDAELPQKLLQVLSQHLGSQELKIILIDGQDRFTLPLYAQELRVDACGILVNKLEELQIKVEFY